MLSKAYIQAKGKRANSHNLVTTKKIDKKSHTEQQRHGVRLENIDKWNKQLQGGRFRHLNEWLYKHKGDEAYLSFQETPHLFKFYHEGYKKQVSQWPINPLEIIISHINNSPKNSRIGDFGCGEAELAARFPERNIHSFDLVASNDRITACNMAQVPLKDSTLDYAVFCLSLMGSDWNLFISEANRCLKSNGILLIIEVSSRINASKDFIEFITEMGFKLEKQEDIKSFFHLFRFYKTKRINSQTIRNIESKSRILKPCLYKKR